jgi:hypothetical protein
VTRGEAFLVHAANLLVGGTGLAYAVVLFFVEPVDEFAVVNHPAQPHLQHLHVLAAPLLVFALGAIWRSHAMASRRFRIAERWRSGNTLIGLAVPMMASGYLLQVAVAEGWRQTWSIVHLATAGLWAAVSVVHLLGPRPPSAGSRSRRS